MTKWRQKICLQIREENNARLENCVFGTYFGKLERKIMPNTKWQNDGKMTDTETDTDTDTDTDTERHRHRNVYKEN